eukprot:6154049-Pyramimonas_sp.AAC.1
MAAVSWDAPPVPREIQEAGDYRRLCRACGGEFSAEKWASGGSDDQGCTRNCRHSRSRILEVETCLPVSVTP